MTSENRKRTIYADWQNDRLVAEYFELDRIQRSGGEVVKQDLYNRVATEIGGKPGGIEGKFQNISAVLASLEMDYARGLKPRPNIQQALADAVERYLDSHPEALFGEAPVQLADPGQVIEVAVPAMSPPSPVLEPAVKRIARKYNYAERDARNRKLGALGERLVLEREKQRLKLAGKDGLAAKVRHVSELDGDGLGYDILSFEPSGQERLIEVKTTNGPATTSFYLSRVEHDVSIERADIWRLHRMHLFASSPSVFVLPPPLAASVTLVPEVWRASF